MKINIHTNKFIILLGFTCMFSRTSTQFLYYTLELHMAVTIMNTSQTDYYYWIFAMFLKHPNHPLSWLSDSTVHHQTIYHTPTHQHLHIMYYIMWRTQIAQTYSALDMDTENTEFLLRNQGETGTKPGSRIGLLINYSYCSSLYWYLRVWSVCPCGNALSQISQG